MTSDEGSNKFARRIAQLQASAVQPDLLDQIPQLAADSASPAPKPAKPSRSKKAGGSIQPDFFTPMLYDVSARDNRNVMDVAVFRLSKSKKRANSVIRYELPDGFVEVSSGPHGMASVWDYDIVLMAVSHLTEAMNQYRAGKGEKPSQTFRPHVGDVLKFCRRENGGNQKDAVVGALQRLSTTYVAIERTNLQNGKLETEGENLIAWSKTVSNPVNKKVEYVEIKIADWMYKEITQGLKPDVLTVHPDYFLNESGIGRFVYRLARKAAGKEMAVWSFKLIYTRSGSQGSIKEFNRMLRALIDDNDLPEYSIAEENGKEGPLLRMVHRSHGDKWKDVTPAAADPAADKS